MEQKDFYGFKNLTVRDEVIKRRKFGRVGVIATSAAALLMGWATVNMPTFEVADNDQSSPVIASALEVVARAPQGAATLVLAGLSINFALGSHALTRSLDEIPTGEQNRYDE